MPKDSFSSTRCGSRGDHFGLADMILYHEEMILYYEETARPADMILYYEEILVLL